MENTEAVDGHPKGKQKRTLFGIWALRYTGAVNLHYTQKGSSRAVNNGETGNSKNLRDDRPVMELLYVLHHRGDDLLPSEGLSPTWTCGCAVSAMVLPGERNRTVQRTVTVTWVDVSRLPRSGSYLCGS